MYYQYPLESLARLRDSSAQLEFARRAQVALPEAEDIACEAMDRGLAIFAANEEALALPARVLQELYGDDVELRGPRIRYIPGTPLHEPVMQVRVTARREWAGAIVQELKLRQGRILEECIRGRVVIVRAEVALALLLGFQAVVSEATGGDAISTVRLSHYAPMPTQDSLAGASS
jgi:hypothetical protein